METFNKYLKLENIQKTKDKITVLYSCSKITDKIFNRESLFEKFESNYRSCKDFIKIKNDENYIERYYLSCLLDKTKDKIATVIMMNPAFATSFKLDDTLMNIKSYLKSLEEEYKAFEILNINPIRTPKPKDLKLFRNFINNDLDKDIDSYKNAVVSYLEKINTCKNYTIIAAWGNELHKEAKVLFAEKKINFYCYATNKNNGDEAPRHFSKQAFNKKEGKFVNKNGKYELKKYFFSDSKNNMKN